MLSSEANILVGIVQLLILSDYCNTAARVHGGTLIWDKLHEGSLGDAMGINGTLFTPAYHFQIGLNDIGLWFMRWEELLLLL